MEIISYVGGRPDNRQNEFNINFLAITKKFKKHGARKISGNAIAMNSSSVKRFVPSYRVKSFSLPKIQIYPRKILKSIGRVWWVLPFIAALTFVPVMTYRAVSEMESRTNPLKFQTEGKTELEILEKEMARVALSDSIIVSEDGSISGSEVSYSFKQPVSFSNYTVKKGDTISGITKAFKLNNISTIIAVNKIDNVRALNAGKKLVIPSVDGLIYSVKAGDSINSIAVKYGVPVEDLLDINDLESEILTAGKDLFIPGAKLDKDTLRRALGDTFINPLKTTLYRLTSRHGYRADPFTGVKQFHPGIDMAISQGSPVYAALNGKVVSCGWSNIYGNYAIIDHGNGYQTLYGHMLKKLCTLNQEVSTGTKIGLVGTTGYSTGPHLHFTVYKNGKPVDPLTLIK